MSNIGPSGMHGMVVIPQTSNWLEVVVAVDLCIHTQVFLDVKRCGLVVGEKFEIFIVQKRLESQTDVSALSHIGERISIESWPRLQPMHMHCDWNIREVDSKLRCFGSWIAEICWV